MEEKKPEDMEYFELCDYIKKANEEFNNDPDHSSENIQKHMSNIDYLEDLRDKKAKEIAEKVAKKWEEKEKKFQEIDFGKSCYMDLIRQVINTGKALRTDDFEYGYWQKEIPENWWEETPYKDEREILDFYYKTMGELEDLFDHLGNFHVNMSDHFPCYELGITVEGIGSFILGTISGQGSDFYIRPMDDNFEYIMTWEDAKYYCKRDVYTQAIWYLETLKMAIGNEEGCCNRNYYMIEDNWAEYMFLLGQSSATQVPFHKKVNINNYQEVLS